MGKELKVSQQTLMEHSGVKLQVLQHYMGAYLSILSNASFITDIRLYDFFSGPGIYEDGGNGSPVIFLNEINQAIERVVNNRRGDTTFHCVFNDLNSEKVDALRDNIETKRLSTHDSVTIQYSSEDYRDLVEKVALEFSDLRSSRGFAFIDPYGYKEIRLKDIQSLLKGGKSEVLLFLPTQFMYRFAKNETPESLKSFLSEVLDIDSLDSSSTGMDFINAVKDGFRSKLGSDHYVDSFVISREKNQFFCLFFFTSNMLGFEKMLDAKWKVDKEEGRGWQFNGGFNLFSVAENSANTSRLTDLLETFLSERQRSNAELYEFTLRNGYLPKHAADILKDMQISGKVKSEQLDGRPARKGAFYLNYQDWDKNPSKIIVQKN